MNAQRTYDIEIMTIDEVVAYIKLGRTSVYNRLSLTHKDADKSFPRSFRVSPSRIAFVKSEVEGWLKKQLASSRS